MGYDKILADNFIPTEDFIKLFDDSKYNFNILDDIKFNGDTSDSIGEIKCDILVATAKE